jgi:hypothetical protein
VVRADRPNRFGTGGIKGCCFAAAPETCLKQQSNSFTAKQVVARQEETSFSPADKLDNLSEEQKEEVEQQSRPNAALIHETIRAEGESELERAASALVLSGFAAGLSMGFSQFRWVVGAAATREPSRLFQGSSTYSGLDLICNVRFAASTFRMAET